MYEYVPGTKFGRPPIAVTLALPRQDRCFDDMLGLGSSHSLAVLAALLIGMVASDLRVHVSADPSVVLAYYSVSSVGFGIFSRGIRALLISEVAIRIHTTGCQHGTADGRHALWLLAMTLVVAPVVVTIVWPATEAIVQMGTAGDFNELDFGPMAQTVLKGHILQLAFGIACLVISTLSTSVSSTGHERHAQGSPGLM